MDTTSFCNDKTLSDLEWSKILDAIAERCSSTAGRRNAENLPFALDRAGAQRAQDEVAEAFHGLMRGETLPIAGMRDVELALQRLKMGGALGPVELRDMGSTLAAARMLRRHLASRRHLMPHLCDACQSDPSLDEVEDEITEAFDADGTLSDRASPRLRELRGEYKTSRARMISRLEELIRRYSGILQDTFWTEREGRYVLPVRTDAHERFPGLVHSTSGSGATLFVEPRVVIQLGNRLKMLEGEIRREEEAIYAQLSSLLIDQLPSVIAAIDGLAHADLRNASAKLTEELGLSFVEVEPLPIVELAAAKHPLLALEGVEVVPSDLRVAGGRAVVISGPNAGGKTVSLKTLGLSALMLRAGLPIPCKAGSRLGLFDQVLSDVGDDQSLQKNLSTFSAHVKNLSTILDQAGHGTLVLLDEIATGTDPREGEALAAAILDGLCARGAAVLCTTHYEGLKALALADNRFENASVGFDVATMSPTFQLVMGVPGASSALAVARRFGVPSLVLDRAQAFLSREERDFEKVVQQLHDERRALELARAAAERAKLDAQAREAELAAEIDAIKTRDTRAIHREVEALAAAVRRARDDLRGVQSKLRSGRKLDELEVRESSRVLDRLASKIAVGGELDISAPEPQAEPLSLDLVRKGAKVYVPRLKTEAEVLELMSGGQVRVSAGALKLTVKAEELRAPTTAVQPPPAPKKNARSETSATPVELAIPTRDTTCDVRGMRVDDAVQMAEQFLDRCISSSLRVMFVVHGHGTGALRDAIRNALTANRYVGRVGPAAQSEGGDGVTVAWLR
ncbi:MAG: Smr/MutS family protein [Polyangiaceae bacterium]